MRRLSLHRGQFSAEAYLEALGRGHDDDIDLLEAAMVLSFKRPSYYREQAAHYRNYLSPYKAHAQELVEAAENLIHEHFRGPLSLEDYRQVVNSVLYDQYDYHGGTEDCESLEDSDLLAVIDRRKGLPVSLGILYIHLARELGLRASGLSFPGHFLLRLSLGYESLFIDPFHCGEVRSPVSRRSVSRRTLGESQAFTSDYQKPISNRKVLLQLQDKAKVCMLERGQATQAMAVLDHMVLLAPHEAVLWREASSLQEKEGNVLAARRSLQNFMILSEDKGALIEASISLQNLKRQLH